MSKQSTPTKNTQKQPKPISVVIGTRAQLVKMAPVLLELQNRQIPYEYIETNQHKITMSDIRKDFGIKDPDKQFFPEQKETKTMGLIWGWFLKAMLKIVFRPKSLMDTTKGIVLVHGDTNSCWMGALLGKLRRNKVMHVESGLRSFNIFKPFPEEINRLITFRLTDVYACPNEWAVKNLKKYKGVKLNTQQNTQFDSMYIALQHGKAETVVKDDKPYVVSSIHRYENVFYKDKLTKIVEIHEKIAKKLPIYLIRYPVTEKRLKKYGLMKRLEDNPNIHLTPRLSFFEYMQLQYNAEFVIADGGSIQEELSYMGKPTLLLRDVSERIEGLGETAVLSKFDDQIIDEFVENYQKYRRPLKKLEQRPSKVIVDWLVKEGYGK